MTLLRSKEGRFYDLPEDSLKKYEVPAQRVKEILAELESETGGSEGDVEPYGYYGGGYGGGYHSPYYPSFFYPYRRKRRYYYGY